MRFRIRHGLALAAAAATAVTVGATSAGAAPQHTASQHDTASQQSVHAATAPYLVTTALPNARFFETPGGRVLYRLGCHTTVRYVTHAGNMTVVDYRSYRGYIYSRYLGTHHPDSPYLDPRCHR